MISLHVMITLWVGHSHCLSITDDELKLGEVKGLTQGLKVSTGQGCAGTHCENHGCCPLPSVWNNLWNSKPSSPTPTTVSVGITRLECGQELESLTGFTYSTLKYSIKLGVEISSIGCACTFQYVCIKIIDVFAHWWRQPSIMQGAMGRTSQNDLFHFHTFTLISLKSFFSW